MTIIATTTKQQQQHLKIITRKAPNKNVKQQQQTKAKTFDNTKQVNVRQSKLEHVYNERKLYIKSTRMDEENTIERALQQRKHVA